jgi:alcohol dehydrogenase class IV
VANPASDPGPSTAADPDIDITIGSGCLTRVTELADGWNADRVLVVASPSAVARTGVAELLKDRSIAYFHDFAPNPRLADALAACAAVEAFQPELVLGIGGGSALDVAKVARIVQSAASTSGQARVPALRDRAARLILAPTTSGTGAEVTRFATVYAGGRKVSVDHARVRADAAIVDPELTAACPREVTMSCLLDALSHAIESYWSRRSTSQSRALAGQALVRLVELADVAGSRKPYSDAQREALGEAALLAGLAIDVTRTTAAHAFAYPTTIGFGIPHGLACALHLAWQLEYVGTHLTESCHDVRGIDFVSRRLTELANMLGAGSPRMSANRFEGLVQGTGFDSRLHAHGVRLGHLPDLIGRSLESSRADNSPVEFRLNPTLAALRTRV